MHSHISAFPSTAFYNSRLLDGPGMDEKTVQPWHSNALFPPYVFMHVKGGSEVAGRHHSLTNPKEAATALAIYERLLRDYPKIDFDYRIGVVTPYKGQVGELKKHFRNRFGIQILSKLTFNTVDVSHSFSFVLTGTDMTDIGIPRTREGHHHPLVRPRRIRRQVGWIPVRHSVRLPLSRPRRRTDVVFSRMNVALTRARCSLFILGDSYKLRSNKYWANLVSDAQSRGLLTEVSSSSPLLQLVLTRWAG